ncbi:hypothetical protein M0R45_035745 [Rubus argutus]|uniref:Uncharacterized protein n=1 Tax=Rubus argutus TaxID=59490 RepID=A0AAW1VXT4_RUBAR
MKASYLQKVKKEIKCLAIDGKRCKSKESKGNTVNKKRDKEWEPDTLRSISETDPRSSCVLANNGRRGSATHEEYYKRFSNFEHKDEVPCNLEKAPENEKLVVNREQSYDSSPCKESDDENEEDDDSIPNNNLFLHGKGMIFKLLLKNCLALVASHQNRTDPEVFFPPESFCCISEVLLPRKYQQP